jgi:hypothetical protein
VQAVRIFTDIPISPSLSLRHHPDRYAFRAGRNLPDKEFRYLRTVIVTAAVHRGFGRQLQDYSLTDFLNLPALGRRQPPYCVDLTLRRPVFLVNSRLDLFTATHLLQWAPLLPKLRGHFAEFLRESYLAPLGILNLPTCVGFGYG